MEFNLGKKKPEGEGSQKPAASGGFFGKKPEGPDLKNVVNDLAHNFNNIERRTRVVEERFGTLSKRNEMIDQNMLKHFKKVNSNIKTINDDIMEVKKDIHKIKSTMDLIIKEIKLSAKKEDVNVLQRYINMWDPVKFVTQNEVESIIKRALE